jgi:hypothetical protein
MICQGAEAHDKDMLLGEHFVDVLRSWQAAPGDQTRGTWRMNSAGSSACFACIAFRHLR